MKEVYYTISVEYEGFVAKVKTIVLPQRKSTIIQFELDDIKDDDFKITLIPRIMRHNKWDKGAELMEHWFKQKKYQIPENKTRQVYDAGNIPFDNKIITLAWIKSLN